MLWIQHPENQLYSYLKCNESLNFVNSILSNTIPKLMNLVNLKVKTQFDKENRSIISCDDSNERNKQDNYYFFNPQLFK